MQPIPLLYFSHHLPQWWWLLLPQACPPSPRHQAQPAGSPPSPGTLLPAPPLLLPPLDRPDQPGRRGQWGPDIANLIWDESDHTVPNTKFYCPTCPCVCPQKFLQVNGREGEGGRKKENTHKRKSNSGVARSVVAVTSKDSDERGWVAGSGDVPRGSPLSRLSLLSEPWKSSSSALGTVSRDLPSQPPKRPVL